MNFNIFERDRLIFVIVMMIGEFIHCFIFDYRKTNKFKRCDHKCHKGEVCNEWMCKYYDKVIGLY